MKQSAAHAKLKVPPGYEKSGMDNDKGVKEGSAADAKRDAKAIAAYKAKRK
jgi:hypothetical protein